MPARHVKNKQALPHRLAWGTWPAQSHSNLTYTNAGGISEYLLFAPLVRRPGAPRLAARQRPIHLHSRGRPAASPAGACDARRLRRVLLGARRRLSPAAGQVFLPNCRRRCCCHRRRRRRRPVGSQAQRSIVEERRRHLAAASQAPRTAAPRAPQPIRLRRAARDAGRRCARLAASCWASAVRSTLLSSMIEALPSS